MLYAYSYSLFIDKNIASLFKPVEQFEVAFSSDILKIVINFQDTANENVFGHSKIILKSDSNVCFFTR